MQPGRLKDSLGLSSWLYLVWPKIDLYSGHEDFIAAKCSSFKVWTRFLCQHVGILVYLKIIKWTICELCRFLTKLDNAHQAIMLRKQKNT